MSGRVQAIYLAPETGQPVEPADRARALAQQGLEGDRYFHPDPKAERAGCDLTCIEREVVAALEAEAGIRLEPGAHRRNVVTEDVELNGLVGKSFQIGSVRCVGLERCEPCAYLEDLLDEAGLSRALAGRGGLRARIVESGIIGTGDSVSVL